MCFHLKKQRTLGILDSEFNQNNKRIGTDAIDDAFWLNEMSQEQFAARGKSAIHQTISKQFLIDHNHSTRSSLALISSDLAEYYDHIVHIAAALALLHVGIPHSRIYSMFDSTQMMIHRIRCTSGDSKFLNGGDDIGEWENFP